MKEQTVGKIFLLKGGVSLGAEGGIKGAKTETEKEERGLLRELQRKAPSAQSNGLLNIFHSQRWNSLAAVTGLI